jgi:hypothetical protein
VASANAIAAVEQAILSLIAGRMTRDEFPAGQFDLYQARDFRSPMEEGISLYLYRITQAGEIRNYPRVARLMADVGPRTKQPRRSHHLRQLLAL